MQIFPQAGLGPRGGSYSKYRGEWGWRVKHPKIDDISYMFLWWLYAFVPLCFCGSCKKSWDIAR